MADRQLFRWQALDEEGKMTHGAFFCHSRQEVMDLLVAKNYQPFWLSSGRRYRARDWKWQHKTSFYRQLATLLKAGLTLSDSLNLIADGHAEAGWCALLFHIRQRVSEGMPFSDVLALWPDVFPALCPALMKVGEMTGQLDECCLQLALQQERQQQLQKKVAKALRYPLFILAVALLVSLGMLVWVLPEFVSVYQAFDAPLPGFTAAVIALSDWLRHFGALFIPLPLLGAACWKWYSRRSPALQTGFQRILLKIPLTGRLYRGGQLSKIFTILSLTQQAGLTLLQSLQAVEYSLNHRLWREAIIGIQQHISSGLPLNQALQQHSLFTPLCYQLIKVGEEAGSLDSLLTRLANFHEQSTQELAETLAASLEPLMMIVTGAIVGTLVIAMYLPVFNLGDALG